MNARTENLSNAAYHAHPAVGNSKLTAYLKNPELYHAQEIAKTIPKDEPSDVLVFGNLFHDSVLRGLHNQAVEIPDWALTANGHRRGKMWEEFKAEFAGRAMLKADEYQRLRDMVDAVWSHPRAAAFLEHTEAIQEQSIFWTDPATGLELKAMIDCRRPGLIADLKSSADVSRAAFARAMHDYGYYRQCAFYKMAAHALTSEEHDFVFIVVEKQPPYRVRCYELDPTPDRALTKAYEDVRAGLEMMARSVRENDWREQNWDEVLTLDLPAWAYSKQWEYTE